MKIAILHYHLNPGGVTRIIEMQLEALMLQPDISEIIVLSGAPDSSIKIPKNVKFICNPDLNYINCTELTPEDSNVIYQRILKFLNKELTADTIIHAHNLNLGKNPILTAVLSQMLRNSYKIVNHIHDFAEDRPANMEALELTLEKHFGHSLEKILYPVDLNCRYAVLNSEYVQRLKDFEVPTELVCLLPNPVKVNLVLAHHQEKAQKQVQQTLQLNPDLPNYVYPVRGIRRKNLGELILLAALFRDKANWITTLPPLNPVEKIEYYKWKDFCREQEIPVIFEAGERCGFAEIMAAADRSVTTSIREGFGMVFLESWFFGLPVVGRDLPVTKDFRNAGVKFEGLYQRLESYAGKDFGDLPQEAQMAYILKLEGSEHARHKFLSANPDLTEIFKNFSAEMISANRELIQKHYSVENYGKELLNIYKQLV